MSAEKALVIFSGGQDSTTCLFRAIRDYGVGSVSCITFHYGQKHAAEVEIARAIAAELGVHTHRLMTLDGYSAITGSALLDSSIAIAREDNAQYPNTVVDGRNMLFLLLAAVYAKSLGIRDLIAGMCETDFSGYPDCRDVFVKSCNVTLNLAMDWPFRVMTPLMFLTKAETWRMADELGCLDFIRDRTLTCYNGIPGAGCGECPSCVLRRRGYDEYRQARLKD